MSEQVRKSEVCAGLLDKSRQSDRSDPEQVQESAVARSTHGRLSYQSCTGGRLRTLRNLTQTALQRVGLAGDGRQQLFGLVLRHALARSKLRSGPRLAVLLFSGLALPLTLLLALILRLAILTLLLVALLTILRLALLILLALVALRRVLLVLFC